MLESRSLELNNTQINKNNIETDSTRRPFCSPVVRTGAFNFDFPAGGKSTPRANRKYVNFGGTF